MIRTGDWWGDAGAGARCGVRLRPSVLRHDEEVRRRERDILIDRVRDARKAQHEAQEEFTTTLERFREVIEVDGGPLEKKYDQINGQLERAEKRARAVADRVLFLKHNLNAKALGALTSELTAVEGNVDSLVTELQSAIAEADAYLAEMEQARTSRRTIDDVRSTAGLPA